MRDRWCVVGAVALLCGALPLTANAAIDSIAVRPNAGLRDFLCIGSTTTAPVLLAVTTAEGTTLQTITLPAPDNVADPGCPSSASTFEPGATATGGPTQPSFHRYPAGARVTATQSGRSVTFALPYAAYSSGTTRIRNIPNPSALSGGVVAAAAAGSYTGAAATEGAPVVVAGTVQDSSAAAIPINELITPAQYAVQLAGSVVIVTGADPLAEPVPATLSAAGGGLVAHTVLRPRVGTGCPSGGCTITGTFDGSGSSGGAVAVGGQTGWFPARDVALPSGGLRLDGFDAGVPTGSTGTYDFALRFVDPESIQSLAAANPLRCAELGPAVTCPGGAPANRQSISVGSLFVVPGDTLDVTATDAGGDAATITLIAGGLSGSLDDGSVSVRGAARAQFSAVLRSPLAPPAAPYTQTTTDVTDATGLETLVDSFSTHIANGATVTVSGPATGPIPQTFSWRLTAGIDASNVVRGTTYPLGAIAVEQSQGGRVQRFQTSADVAGAFAVQLADARAGDIVNVYAANPDTHQLTTTAMTVGGPSVKITGVSDGQFVRGTITPTVAGTGLDSVLWNGVDASLPSLLAPAAPFPYPLDSTRWNDGAYRLEASGRPDTTAYDYTYVAIDNTPPTGGAGNDQTVARGRTVTFATGAGDGTSGLASVKIDFGDSHRLTQFRDSLGSPISHIYTRVGTYTAVLTITDIAGNATTDSAKIRVATTVAPQVGGTFPGKLVRKRQLTARLVGRQPGQLEIFILSDTGVRKATKRVTFTKAGQRIKVTLLTKGLKLGRFVLVEQFTDGHDIAGPVQARALRIVKR